MSVTHDTFVIERHYPVPPAKVFAAWADPAAKAKWFAGPDEWQSTGHELDFRVGGLETVAGGHAGGGPVFTYRARYCDIVPDERIVHTYEMYQDDARLSVSVATVEFRKDGNGTHLVYTEQGAYLDGLDSVGSRRHGTGELLDALGRALDG
jgi:uncharacterized protein YndB with AHSA1/START domain